jgi:hypothetical protein
MKIFVFLVFYVSYIASAKGQSNNNMIISDRIEYSVMFHSILLDNESINNISKIILDSNSIKKSSFIDAFYNYYMRIDTVINPKRNPSQFLLEIKQKNISLLSGMKFIEKWEIDTNTLIISKTIESYNPLYIIERDFEYIGDAGFSLSILNNNSSDKYLCIARNVVYDVWIYRPCEGNPDFIENIPSYYKNRFIKTLFHNLINNHNVCYNIDNYNALSIKDIINSLITFDTITHSRMDTLAGVLSNNFHGYCEKFTSGNFTIEECLHSSSSIQKFRFCEDWFINIDNLSFKKIVKSYAPILVYGRSENFYTTKKTKVLFWIYSDK